jgi:hypothetical protein
VKRPEQRRRFKRKSLIDLPPPLIGEAAAKPSYSGSSEHKLPHARSDATLCPPDLEGQGDMLTSWLRKAIQLGHVGGLIEGVFPRYVWYWDGYRMFEGRLPNHILGEYHGYPIEANQAPAGLIPPAGLIR